MQSKLVFEFPDFDMTIRHPVDLDKPMGNQIRKMLSEILEKYADNESYCRIWLEHGNRPRALYARDILRNIADLYGVFK